MPGARLALAVLALALEPGCAVAQSGSPQPTPNWDMITFETKSWGGALTSWSMFADGSGTWTEAVRAEGEPPTAPATLAWHDFDGQQAGYTALENILARLPQPAPNSEDCETFMNDAPYGTLRMTKGATTTEIVWNDGCMDEDYRKFIGVLREADQHVAAIGKAAPVSRTEEPTVD